MHIREVDVPTRPGVYAFYRDGVPVYVGSGTGRTGLRGRVWKLDLATGTDLSRSSFRRNVCDELRIAPTSVTRQRPPQLRAGQVEPVNVWVRACKIAWLTFDVAPEAKRFETVLKNEWKPRLTTR